MLKRSIYILLLLLTVSVLSAQPYANEWINFSQSYYKIKIIKTGLVRIDSSTLASSGIPLITVLGENFQVFNKGVEIPIYTSTNGLLSGSDFIEFFAEANDGSFDKNLFKDTSWQLQQFSSLFTDTATYFITWNASSSNNRIIVATNDTLAHPPKETSFIHNSLLVNTNILSNGKPYAVLNEELYSSQFEEGEGFLGLNFAVTSSAYPDNRTYVLNTPFIDMTGIPATIQTTVLGSSDAPHHLTIDVESVNFIDDTYTGYGIQRYSFNVPLANLGNPSTTLKFTALDNSIYDKNNVSYISIDYPRIFDFNSQSTFSFKIAGDAINPKFLEIDNYNTLATTPILYDFTNKLRLNGIVVGGQTKFELPISINERTLFLSSQSATDITNITQLEAVNFIDYSNLLNQGDYLVISHNSLLDDGSGNDYVADYTAYRNTTGFTAKTIMIEQLYDQFAYGISKHPLSIKNFIQYAVDNWITKPTYVLLLGKGINYSLFNTAYNQCLIPTFGYPESDILLSAQIGTYTPQASVGRLSARTANDIKIYLDKVIEYENNQLLPQTLFDKQWMKRVLHLGGGSNASEQNLFKSYLSSYENIIEDTFYGGNVTSFYKTSSDPIQISTAYFLDSLINAGVSLMTFFGHGSSNSFDYSVDNPSIYTNKGKYPLIVSNACFVGSIHGINNSLSEDFVLIEDKGAIGFLSSVNFATVSGLNTYSEEFYRSFSYKYYNQGIGIAMQNTASLIASTLNSTFNRLTTEQFSLHGDPAIKLNTHTLPDYVIESNNVNTVPSIISVSLSQFELNYTITNIGEAVNDSIYIEIERTFPDGTSLVLEKRKIKATLYQDKLQSIINIDPISDFGLNKFTIRIDPDNDVLETDDIVNNETSINIFILADDVLPVYPYEFSIVSQSNIVLKASTATTITGIKNYMMEIDTSENFNSPLKQSTTISQIGGLLKWQATIPYLDSTVYYWRVAIDTIYNGGAYNWHNSSFIYINSSSSGWNQSHYFQFKKDFYANIELPSNRKFKYVDDVKDLRVVTGMWDVFGGPLPREQIAYYLNTVKQHNWKCNPLTGWYIAVFDSSTGLPWESPPGGSVGEINCKTYNFKLFRWDLPAASWPNIVNFINSIPDGNFVLTYSLNFVNTAAWDTTMYKAFESLGATQIRNAPNSTPYVLFSQKGNASFPVVEVLGDTVTNTSALIDTTISFSGIWDEGYIESTIIGPAAKWNSLHWRSIPGDASTTDSIGIDIIGIMSDETEVVLKYGLVNTDTILNFIDANIYPQIKLRLNAKDDSLRSATQLQYWRVLFDELPEAAFNPSDYYSFSSDTLSQGQNINLALALENISNVDMDSMLVAYSILDANNNVGFNTQIRYDSLFSNDSIIPSIQINSLNLATGKNTLFVEANPANDQPEQFHFNNIALISINVVGDNANPLLDVTFDGVRILSGDIVSAKPNILIRMKDENKYLALDDTSLINVFLQYPKGNLVKMNFDNNIMTFYPPNTGNLANNNTAEIDLKPILTEDGTYKLIVQGQDKSGNASGDLDYKIAFEVINKSTITNVLNYPNPFTTSTRFVFTLTGYTIPEYFKIQIMTITGKIVKEILQAELGNIHIGNNITEYAWDGTDEFGDRLANGVYLYRVVTKINGEDIDYRNNNTDKYFKSGFGKMYLMK